MVGLNRSWTWLLTLALPGGAFAAIGLSINNRWDGIFIGPQNKISLSRFQLVVWTLVIGSSLLTAGLGRASLSRLDFETAFSEAPPIECSLP